MNEGRTAIHRKNLSSPAKWLSDNKLIAHPALDYRCGKGMDAALLKIESYDPVHKPLMPFGEFQTILCTYVLNVVDAETGDDIIEDILYRLKYGGRAFITVRRDFKKDYRNSYGVEQRIVKLGLPIIHETRNYCIYSVGIKERGA